MIFAWQGWQLALPDDCSPVKLEGNFESGYALIADIHRPRVGLKWMTPGRRFDSGAWARKSLVEEVGTLAASEATSYSPPPVIRTRRVSGGTPHCEAGGVALPSRRA